MTNEEFRSTLSLAIAGNEDALADLIELYTPLINRFSLVDGRLDEDLRQCILIEIVKSISNFKILSEDD